MLCEGKLKNESARFPCNVVIYVKIAAFGSCPLAHWRQVCGQSESRSDSFNSPVPVQRGGGERDSGIPRGLCSHESNDVITPHGRDVMCMMSCVLWDFQHDDDTSSTFFRNQTSLYKVMTSNISICIIRSIYLLEPVLFVLIQCSTYRSYGNVEQMKHNLELNQINPPREGSHKPFELYSAQIYSSGWILKPCIKFEGQVEIMFPYFSLSSLIPRRCVA